MSNGHKGPTWVQTDTYQNISFLQFLLVAGNSCISRTSHPKIFQVSHTSQSDASGDSNEPASMISWRYFSVRTGLLLIARLSMYGNRIMTLMASYWNVFLLWDLVCIWIASWHYYRPQAKLWEGTDFTRICQSFCPQGIVSQHSPGQEVYTPSAHTPLDTYTPVNT